MRKFLHTKATYRPDDTNARIDDEGTSVDHGKRKSEINETDIKNHCYSTEVQYNEPNVLQHLPTWIRVICPHNSAGEYASLLVSMVKDIPMDRPKALVILQSTAEI
jgi:hypothetical protein